jgi:Arrestin (or S-antigen), N-terminal domain
MMIDLKHEFFLGIKVKFLGEAKTTWKETESVRNEQTGKTESHSKDVEGHEEYFQISYYLLGNANSGETELKAGAHTYNITCALPQTLPSSFEGEHGYIRYTVKVTIGMFD